MEPNSFQTRFRKTAYSWLLGDYPPEQFPQVAIIPFENPDLFDPTPLVSQLTGTAKAGSFTVGKYKNTRVAVSSPKFGAPAAAMAVDVLGLTSVHDIIGIGYCGLLLDAIMCGDLVIPTAALIDEGTSHLYDNADKKSLSDPRIVHRLLKQAKNLNISTHSGIIWSTDGILRESDEKIRAYYDQNAIAVDMESSAAFTAGSFYNKNIASVLIGSDNPRTNEQADLNRLRTGYRQAIQLVLETVAST